MRSFFIILCLGLGLSLGAQSELNLQLFSVPTTKKAKQFKTRAEAEQSNYQDLTLSLSIPEGKHVQSFQITLANNKNQKGQLGEWTFDPQHSEVEFKHDAYYIHLGTYKINAKRYLTAIVQYSDGTTSEEKIFER